MSISLSPVSSGKEAEDTSFQEVCQRSVAEDEQGRLFEHILDGSLTAEELLEIEQRWGLHACRWSLISALSGKLTAGVQTLFSNQV